MLDFEKKKGTGTPQRQGTAPPPIGNTTARLQASGRTSGQSSAGISGDTYVSHITIPGLGTAKFGFDDAQEQRNGEDFLRRMAQSESSAIR